MKNFEIYKEFYFHEIARKGVLNSGINIPILVITGLLSIHFFLFKQELNVNVFDFGKLISSLTLLSVLVSLYFLIKSFSNFLSGHKYRELTDMVKLRDFEINLVLEQDKKEDAQLLFDEYLVFEFSECAKHNFYVNKTRTEDLAKAKIFLIIGLLLTIIFSVIYIISIV